MIGAPFLPMLNLGGAAPIAYDLVPLAGAWGMRRLLTSHTGALLRLRRVSDSAESDFGYVAATGALDTSAISTWIGGSSAKVKTWYDQSGNGNHWAQTIFSGYEPTYNASGIQSKPTVQFAGGEFLHANGLAALFTGSDLPLSLLAIIRYTTLSGVKTFFALNRSSNGNPAHRLENNGTTWRQQRNDDAGSGKGDSPDNASTATNYLFEQVFSGTAGSLYRNGTLLGAGNADLNVGALTLDLATLGANRAGGTPGLYCNAHLAEVVVYNAAWSTAQRQAAEGAANAYWAIY